VSGNSSKAWSCETCVVSTWLISIMNYVMPSNECGGSHALSKAVSRELDFSSLCTGQ
jgi:hypothetical protein